MLRDPATLTAALNWYRASRTRDGEGLESVPVPTLYVWGTEDVALGRSAAERTGSYVSGPYRFEVLEGAGHWIAETHSEQLSSLLLEHLAGQSPPSR
jgi:pimeloyl-ACP methyl ester carboxylesterase